MAPIDLNPTACRHRFAIYTQAKAAASRIGVRGTGEQDAGFTNDHSAEAA